VEEGSLVRFCAEKTEYVLYLLSVWQTMRLIEELINGYFPAIFVTGFLVKGFVNGMDTSLK
jgi:hypothetical protein